ncbi:MAG: putative phage tail protein [Anaerobutyricum hallii]|uniref:putative phage tail protein n=1 Tax=Anaerobutyricum hallii TaxID=39488 RepID=UPI002A7FDD9E|nr:putative phage tail protein [Anaerobutyricum hallii]MDY4577020.1 putative phage tail protein [Anaerobutyricum hallii]MDY5245759.1 putative phage tail protein [Anaerobutyricum soehngenii]
MQLEYPDIILNIDEIKAIYDSEEITGTKLEDDILSADADVSTITATESGVAHREKILGIKPQDTQSLEERRFQVLLKWTDSFPYTEESLQKKLNELIGEKNYTLEIDYEVLNAKIMLSLDKRDAYDYVMNFLEEILPLNLYINLEIEFNRYKLLSQFTYGELKKYTHKELREHVFKPGINNGEQGDDDNVKDNVSRIRKTSRV